MNQLLTGEVAWYVTGRFYTDGSTIRDIGYFLHVQGIDGPIFNGDPGESTAQFTFSSDPFTAKKISNGDLSISLDATGQFSLYYNPEGGASFDDPASFAAGQRIAVFSRVSMVAGLTILTEVKEGTEAFASNVFSASLVWSAPFTFGGREYDLKNLIPNGVTQWGTASTTLPPGPAPSTSVVPFVGSAIAVGGNH